MKYSLVSSGNLFRLVSEKSFSDVRKGDLGGLVSGSNNLPQKGDFWISDEAKVSGQARVFDKVQVSDKTQVCNQAQVFDQAKVFDKTQVSDEAKVSG